MFRVAFLAALAALVLPGAAEAHWDLAPDGNPKITPGWFSPETVTAAVCPPGADACTPVAWTDRAYLPGETDPGTTSEVRYADGRTERSRPWQGRVQSLGAPTITGRLYATGDALPAASAWAGGWGDDVSALQLAACRTAAGAGCVSLPQISGCPVPCETVKDSTSVSYGGLAGIPTALSGRYLIATETREPRDKRGWPLASPALWSMSHEYALAAPTGLQSLSAPIGPLGLPAQVIVEPVAPTVSSVKLRARALRAGGRLTLGRITCTPRCTVSVKVSGGGKKPRTTTFTVVGTKAITTPRRRGKLTVRVHVDGKLAANGRVTAR